MASCTRKLFRTMAEELRDVRPETPGTPEHDLWEAMVSRVAAVLKHENSNFNMDMFITACAK